MNKDTNLISITAAQLEYYLERNTLVSRLQSQISNYEDELLLKNQHIDLLKKELLSKTVNSTIHSRNSSSYYLLSLFLFRLTSNLPSSPKKSIIQQNMTNYSENLYINQIKSLSEEIETLKTRLTNESNNYNKQMSEKENEIRKLEMIYKDEEIKSKIKLEEKQSEIELLHKQIKDLEKLQNETDNSKNDKKSINFKDSEIMYYYEEFKRNQNLRDEAKELKVENDELKLEILTKSRKTVKNEKIEEMSKKIKELEYKLNSVKLFNNTINHYINLRNKEIKENEKLNNTLNIIKTILKNEYDMKIFITNENKNIKILKFNESENSSIVSDDSSDLIGNSKCRINSYDENDT